MSTTLYLYRSCTSCRNAENHLRASEVDYRPREFFKERFTREELESVLNTAGMKPSELVSRRSKVFRNEGLGDQDLSEDEWIERMLAEPTLIRRPILIDGDQVIVGFDRKRYAATFPVQEPAQD